VRGEFVVMTRSSFFSSNESNETNGSQHRKKRNKRKGSFHLCHSMTKNIFVLFDVQQETFVLFVLFVVLTTDSADFTDNIRVVGAICSFPIIFRSA